MTSPTFSRPQGFYDRTAAESAAAAQVAARLQDALTRFGYQRVETPFVEYADLFLTKSGDDAVNRLFTFELYGRLLCLRSEFTPSAARMYVERFQHEPKPLRWQFLGEVFRYEAPQRNHSRQFTMLGTELIGASGVGADAETLGMAMHGLQTLGLQGLRLVIGHVGLLALLIAPFNLDRRLRRFVLGQVENLRRAGRGRAYVEAELAKLYGGLPNTDDRTALSAEALSADSDKLGSALQLLLESADLGTTGVGRTSTDIAKRLLTKQRRASQRADLMQALDFLEQLCALDGAPEVVLPALERLIPPEQTAARAAFAELRAVIGLLPAYGVPPEAVRLNMGFARGLNYYSGIVFEVYSAAGDQLCGGGRYDELIRVLGAAADTPAIGFAYGLDRVLAALGTPKAAESAPIALVVPIEDADDAEAARTAMALRAHGNIALYAPPTRNLSQVLAHAAKRNIPYVILIGTEERATNRLSLRDMHRAEQVSLSLAEAAEYIQREVRHA
ncbi:MAG: histidine--tRNA ligase family protein [Chloroflexi bacterium CFX4]|nr:histidine--tRNA ligase family protein [Chloroflexi bacterium CFX4]MDL1923764.1 histidine--tRNA ligase family protein [Chloroflexi bacterium CFX3]